MLSKTVNLTKDVYADWLLVMQALSIFRRKFFLTMNLISDSVVTLTSEIVL